jgi:hypothetical protein
MLPINLVVFNQIRLTIDLLEPSHYNIILTEMNASGDSTLLCNVGDQPTNINCVKYHNIIDWTVSIWKLLQILSLLLVSTRFIMNKTVPVTPLDLLTIWPVLIRKYLSIVCVIFSICNFIQIIPVSGCVQKPFSRSQSALNLAESNKALFETALLLFPPMACHFCSHLWPVTPNIQFCHHIKFTAGPVPQIRVKQSYFKGRMYKLTEYPNFIPCSTELIR